MFGNCKHKTTFQEGSFTHFPIPKPTHMNRAVSIRFSGRNKTISVGISANQRVRCQILRWDESGAGVTDLEPHPCFFGIC